MLLVLCLGVALGSHLEKEWIDHPRIEVCPDSNVKITHLSTAAKQWENIGHKFGSITRADDCSNFKPGVIQIKGDAELNVTRYYALTDTYYNSENILYADIKVDRHEADNVTILTHELGHALGYNHVDDVTSIMYYKVK